MPGCQIPWAIFQQICVKWNHMGLPEDLQNQQRGQRMRMIHIVTMNIIHSDTDDNKVSECAGFQSCLPLYRIHTDALTGVAISFQALIWHFDMSHKILLFICSHLWIIYMSPHTMITQLKTFHSKIVHNCYWYADYTYCPWINDALVTGHETWLAHENYIWPTVTSYIHIQSW